MVESVEARSDGYLYIFLEKAAEEGEVEVSFTNPAEGGLQYAEGEAITGNVLDFTEKAELKDTFNKDGEISSWLYGEAQCVATTPLDGSLITHNDNILRSPISSSCSFALVRMTTIRDG